MSLDKTVKWIDKTEGRDKFCKAIQYACRFLKYRFTQSGDKEAAKKFDALFSNMRDARKLFRLFKSLNQYKKIKDMLKKDLDADNILNIITRIFFMCYWFFDNLNILSKIKILNQESKKMAKTGATFWFLALTTNLILVIKNFITIYKKIDKLKNNFYSSPNESEIIDKRKQFGAARTQIYNLLLSLIKLLGDMIPAGQASQILPNFFGINASDGACGLGGFIAALITSYQLYQ